jgi:protein O-mannosyl-transferase
MRTTRRTHCYFESPPLWQRKFPLAIFAGIRFHFVVNQQTRPFRPLCSPCFICALLVAATIAVYFPVHRFSFLDYDDGDYFFNNPHVVSGLKWPNIQWAFTSGELANWHPVTWLSLMLDATLFGAGPVAPHVINVLLQAANSVLLFLLLLRLTSAIWRSAAVAMLFAIHPLHVESVAWISERKDLLCAFFGLLSLWCYARYVGSEGESSPSSLAAPKRSEGGSSSSHSVAPVQTGLSSPFYWLALLFFACGLMSKGMLVTLPFVMLLLDFWPLQRFNPGTLPHLIIEKIPFFLLAAAASVVTYMVQHSGNTLISSSTEPMNTRLANAFVSYARYLGKIFYPVRLVAVYPNGSWIGLIVFLSFVLFAGICVAAFATRKKYPWFLTGWYWFAGMLVPVIGLVQVGEQSMADRYAYLPLAGVLIIVVWAVGEFCLKYEPPRPAILALAVILFAVCAGRARDQVLIWKNDETLFAYTLATTQHNYVAEVDMGHWYAKNGQLQQALKHYEDAGQNAPGNPTALYDVGNSFARLGDWPDAIRNYERALQIVTNQPTIMNNLGLALAQNKQLTEAIHYFRAALKLRPSYAEAHNNLGSALYMQGDYVNAGKEFLAASQAAPDQPQYLANLGDTLARLGKNADAAQCYQKALQLDPDNGIIRGKLEQLSQ